MYRCDRLGLVPIYKRGKWKFGSLFTSICKRSSFCFSFFLQRSRVWGCSEEFLKIFFVQRSHSYTRWEFFHYCFTFVWVSPLLRWCVGGSRWWIHHRGSSLVIISSMHAFPSAFNGPAPPSICDAPVKIHKILWISGKTYEFLGNSKNIHEDDEQYFGDKSSPFLSS
jgi:hypothetical protein